ncbi:MAG: PHB depolymerase family esterase [Myxococcota bacterium]
MRVFGRHISAMMSVGLLVLALGHVVNCGSTPDSPGKFERKTLVSGGLEREYFVYTPSRDAAGQSLPLVVGLHGYGGTATGFEEETSGGLNRHAEEAGYIAVYPQGSHFWYQTGDSPVFISSWNDLETNRLPGSGERPICSNPQHGYPCPEGCGNCGGCGWTSCLDDVGFIAEVIEAVSREYPVDTSRRYLVGLSNGGAMAHRFACLRPDLLAAAVSLSGSIPRDRSCRPGSPVSYMQVYGDQDAVTPIDGQATAGGFFYERPADSFERWADAMGCDASPAPADLAVAKANGLVCTARRNCSGGSEDEVVNCLVPGGGHAWPGHSADVGWCRGELQRESIPGYADCRDQRGRASDWGIPAIWEFLARHRSKSG